MTGFDTKTKEYPDRQQSKTSPYWYSVQFFISSVWYSVSSVHQCPRNRSRQMRQWQSPQSYLPRWMESVYELEREDDGSWHYSEHRTKELFQQHLV